MNDTKRLQKAITRLRAAEANFNTQPRANQLIEYVDAYAAYTKLMDDLVMERWSSRRDRGDFD